MWYGFALAMHIDPASGSQTREIVGTYAINVAIGGVVAWLSGWYGSIARQSGSTSRPNSSHNALRASATSAPTVSPLRKPRAS